MLLCYTKHDADLKLVLLFLAMPGKTAKCKPP